MDHTEALRKGRVLKDFQPVPSAGHAAPLPLRCPASPPLPSLPTFRPPPPTQHKAKEDRSHRHCHRDEQHRCGRRTPCEWGVSRVPQCGAWGGTRLQTHCHEKGGERVASAKMEEWAPHRNLKNKSSKTHQNRVFRNPSKQSRVCRDHVDTGA